MKPKIGDVVYICIGFDNIIEKDKVGYLGKTGFVIDNYIDYEDLFDIGYGYDDYGVTWFRTLEEAEKRMVEIYGSGTKLKKDDGYWKAVKPRREI